MSIPDKTAEGYITMFSQKGLIHREKQDHYLKLNAKTVQSQAGEIEDSKEVQEG